MIDIIFNYVINIIKLVPLLSLLTHCGDKECAAIEPMSNL